MTRVTIDTDGRKPVRWEADSGFLWFESCNKKMVTFHEFGNYDPAAAAQTLLTYAQHVGAEHPLRTFVREMVVNCGPDFFVELHQEDEMMQIFYGQGEADG